MGGKVLQFYNDYSLGKNLQFSNDRMVSELGIQPRPVKESIIDTCYSLIDLGIAKKTPGYLGHPSKRLQKGQTFASLSQVGK